MVERSSRRSSLRPMPLRAEKSSVLLVRRMMCWSVRTAISGKGMPGSLSMRMMLACSAALRLRRIPMLSIWSVVWRSPAVSRKRNTRPSIWAVSSTMSRVVPCMGLTMARSSPTSWLSSVDLPTLGAPMMATGMPLRMALPVA